jgi:hypothetical protein
MNLTRLVLSAIAISMGPHLAIAADAKTAAAQTAAKLDDDFFLQGEYAGSLSTGSSSPASTGLQVIALGQGTFQAVEYTGGLPGNGWDQKTRKEYSGLRTAANSALLTGNGRRLAVRRGAVVVKDDADREIGRLMRVLRQSQTFGAPPPAGAQVLFCGRDAREFTGGVVTPDHLLIAGADTKGSYADFSMHVEFRTPYMAPARGQSRGNSGVYIQKRYEVQILDSFGLRGVENECGGLYKQRSPLVNMCFPPLTWQTYDIDFTAARFNSAGKKTANALITVRHNGVVIHDNVAITGKTGGGAAEGPDPAPIKLQDHGNLVHFRNIWIVRSGKLPACDVVPECVAQDVRD